MSKIKKYSVILIYVLLNIMVFIAPYYHTLFLIEEETNDSTLFLFIRSLSFVIVFNFLIFLIIKIKKIDIRQYLN